MKKQRWLTLIFVIFISVVLLFGLFKMQVTTGYGQHQPPTTSQRSFSTAQLNSSVLPLNTFLKAIAIVAVFFVIIYALVRSSRNLIYTKGLNNSPTKIQIKGSNIIAPKKYLFLVEALGHILLLGITETQISVLLDIPWEALNEEQKLQWNQDNNSTDPNFKKILRSLLRK
jgi:flagellar biogenesis protein FliO